MSGRKRGKNDDRLEGGEGIKDDDNDNGMAGSML